MTIFTVPFDPLVALVENPGRRADPAVWLVVPAFLFHLGAARLYNSIKRSPERMQRIGWGGYCCHVPRWLVLSVCVMLWALALLSAMAAIGGMSQ